MKRSDGKGRGSVERKKGRDAGQDYNESPLCLILDIERRLRKMNRVDSQAFLEMLRTSLEYEILSEQTLKGYLDISNRFLNAPTLPLGVSEPCPHYRWWWVRRFIRRARVRKTSRSRFRSHAHQPHNFFLFTPLVHEIAASDLDLTHIVNPIRKMLRHVHFFRRGSSIRRHCETSGQCDAVQLLSAPS